MKLDTFDIFYVIIYSMINTLFIGWFIQVTFKYESFSINDCLVMFVIFFISVKIKINDIKIEYLEKDIKELQNYDRNDI